MTSTQPAGYLAEPSSGAGPGALVLHAWWGLNDTIRAFCDRLAAAGFVAFAPDLYHGQVADTIEAADEFEPQANVAALEEALTQAGRPVTFYRYPDTGHWFFEPDRSQAYNQAAAELAWERTLVFLQHAAATR